MLRSKSRGSTAMAQLVKTRKVSDSPKTPAASQISPTFEQLLRVEDVPWPTNTSPTFGVHHDQEEYASSTPNKKSVIAKVKERAKKLRYSLSVKRKQIFEQNDDDNNGTPPWGVNLEDYDDEPDEDPEYLGAPMYESEAAPKSLRETARQHPRAVPVVSENRKVPSMMKLVEKAQENEKSADANKTITDAVSEKLGPAYDAVSDATHKITSKIAGLTVATAQTLETAASPCQNQGGSHEKAPAHAACDVREKFGRPKQHSASGPQTWDKGVSIKEYVMNKLEPGDDERALSQAILEAISPRSRDTGVVEKMKSAVTSLFRHEDSNSRPKDSSSSSSGVNVTNTQTFTQQKHRINLAKADSSIASYQARANSQATQQVPEEQNHGQILQTN